MPNSPLVRTRRAFLRDAAVVASAIAAAPTLATAARAGATTTDDVVSVAIHPAVGIARVGNSEDSFFFGPEVPGGVARPKHGYKDAAGAIARQAARFRLYGYDRQGRVVRELTEADGAIEWTVNVANKKAWWYTFDVALDLPIATPVARRNPAITGADRNALVVAPGPQTIAGRARTPVALDGGAFMGEAVPLGELMVDGAGRLVFVPARGLGYSPTSAPFVTFSDNNGWADDICDGPVQAAITIGHRTLQAAPAWVVSTPPNYGPSMATGLVTAFDSARTAWHEPTSKRPVSFGDEILPVLTRIVDMQWVNAGFLRSNGWNSDGDFLDPPTLSRLADPSRSNRAYRNKLFAQFRGPELRDRRTRRSPRAVRRRRGTPGRVAVPVVDGDTDPISGARTLGCRRLRRRPRPQHRARAARRRADT